MQENRCFTYCGEDLCDCGAAVNFIVQDVTAKFGAELRELCKPQRPPRKELDRPRFYPSHLGRQTA